MKESESDGVSAGVASAPGTADAVVTVAPTAPASSNVATANVATAVAGAIAAALARQALPPKGACWYCDKPLDSVRRFCSKGCADAFDEESGFIR